MILNKSRIVFLALAVAALIAAFALFTARQSQMPPIDQGALCESLPPNMEKLGPALTPAEATEAIASYGQEWDSVKVNMRPGDTIHEFETGVTGGHVVLRGKCYVGQAVAWIR